MSISLVITGTDTGIGKTIFTASLALALLNKGARVGVFKPIQTGTTTNIQDDAGDLATIKALCNSTNLILSNAYNFKLPATPALASQHQGITISIERIHNKFSELAKQCDCVLIEGAGGLFVPVNNNLTMADLLSSFEVPAILVCPNRLGVINHAGLSHNFAKSKHLNLSGFVMNFCCTNQAEYTCSEVASSNADYINKFTEMYYLGELRKLELESHRYFEESLYESCVLNPTLANVIQRYKLLN